MQIRKPITIALALALVLAGCSSRHKSTGSLNSKTTVVPGQLPVKNSDNIYSEAGTNMLSTSVKNDLPRVYVPNRGSDTISVIDPKTLQVINTFNVGKSPQHITPSFDMRTLWVTNNAEGTPDGSLTPIDPTTGKPGTPVQVSDPYNMYFTPDGKSMVVVAEALRRLDFRDPHTQQLQFSIKVPDCAGVNHADFSGDGSYFIASCEFGGKLVKIDWIHQKIIGYLTIAKDSMPQDVRVGPDGKTYYVAEMMGGKIYVVDGPSFTLKSTIATLTGTHGLYFSRDATKLYASNRGFSSLIGTHPSGPGSISVIDVKTNTVTENWPIPGGGSPDMGNLSADGKQLWLSGRYDRSVYEIDTDTGVVHTIAVGVEPHGLTVWPQPGRYSLGHTGLMR